MRWRWRYLVPLVVVAGLVVLFWVGLHHDPSKVPSPLIGKRAPSFALPALKNADKTVTNEHFKGQVTLVNVWASWCVSCRAESAVLDELAHRQVVLIVGLDYKDKRSDAIKWLGTYGDPYDVSVFDASGDVGIDWGVYGVPETYVVDKKGYIRLKHIGPLTQKDIKDKILPLVTRLKNQS